MITVEKGNLIEVTGGNKKQRELTADIAHWCIRQLMPRMRTLDIWIHLKGSLEFNAVGYCWEGENNREHFVEVKKSLEGDDFKTCIMHEMVHVKQQARDEFQPALQKMEDEAYEKQEILLERWKDDK
jgi:hypothetical protein